MVFTVVLPLKRPCPHRRCLSGQRVLEGHQPETLGCEEVASSLFTAGYAGGGGQPADWRDPGLGRLWGPGDLANPLCMLLRYRSWVRPILGLPVPVSYSMFSSELEGVKSSSLLPLKRGALSGSDNLRLVLCPPPPGGAGD